MKSTLLLSLLILCQSALTHDLEHNGESAERDTVNSGIAYLKIAGTYRGAMFSQSEESTLGNVELVIMPEIEINTEENSTEPRVSLKGALTLFDKSRTKIFFTSGSYDQQSGAFTINAPVDDKKIKINGVVSQGYESINANIIAEGADPKFGVKIILKKNAPVATTNSFPSFGTTKYLGHIGANSRISKLTVTVSDSNFNSNSKFYYSLMGMNQVALALDLDDEIHISTIDGFLKTNSNELFAHFDLGDGGAGIRLICSGNANDDLRKCTLNNSRLENFEITLSRIDVTHPHPHP